MSTHRPAVVLRAADLAGRALPYVQHLDSEAPFLLTGLSRLGGLGRVRISLGRIPPGGRSFAYHAHQVDEEWIYVLEGRGVARIDGAEVALGPGDFVAFPAPQVPHQLTNPHDTELRYLFGGDDAPVDVLEYPDLGKRFVLVPEGGRVAFYELTSPSFPFGSAEAPPPWRVLAAPGWGSAIAEAALTLAGLPWVRETLDLEGPDKQRLLALNPLGQLPTVVLPDGSVLTESAAIVLRAAELAPHAGLAPSPDDPRRTTFLRWLAFLVAAVYPTFTYGDAPARWAPGAEDALRASTDAHRLSLWRQLEAEAAGPWFLGTQRSAIDLYLAVMSRWRPGRKVLAEIAPKAMAIAERLDAVPALAEVWTTNFPPR